MWKPSCSSVLVPGSDDNKLSWSDWTSKDCRNFLYPIRNQLNKNNTRPFKKFEDLLPEERRLFFKRASLYLHPDKTDSPIPKECRETAFSKLQGCVALPTDPLTGELLADPQWVHDYRLQSDIGYQKTLEEKQNKLQQARRERANRFAEFVNIRKAPYNTTPYDEELQEFKSFTPAQTPSKLLETIREKITNSEFQKKVKSEIAKDPDAYEASTRACKYTHKASYPYLRKLLNRIVGLPPESLDLTKQEYCNLLGLVSKDVSTPFVVAARDAKEWQNLTNSLRTADLPPVFEKIIDTPTVDSPFDRDALTGSLSGLDRYIRSAYGVHLDIDTLEQIRDLARLERIKQWEAEEENVQPSETFPKSKRKLSTEGRSQSEKKVKQEEEEQVTPQIIECLCTSLHSLAWPLLKDLAISTKMNPQVIESMSKDELCRNLAARFGAELPENLPKIIQQRIGQKTWQVGNENVSTECTKYLQTTPPANLQSRYNINEFKLADIQQKLTGDLITDFLEQKQKSGKSDLFNREDVARFPGFNPVSPFIAMKENQIYHNQERERAIKNWFQRVWGEQYPESIK